jgi:glycosyltransferase involved in cell wall biosynthesis
MSQFQQGDRNQPRRDALTVSVVIPARNAGGTLGECLRALQAQTLAADEREVIVVVDEPAEDATAATASTYGATVVTQSRSGAARGRNVGIARASGKWVAFTDADCIPTRGWLTALVEAAEAASRPDQPALGAAGPTVGYQSTSAAARFVDMTGGLQAEKHLAHTRYPWAPTANVLYSRSALLAVGGFDGRFVSYEGCDLHTRLLREVGGSFVFAPRALVYHRHRAGWRAYWRQQLNYGRGYAQFFRRYEPEIPWCLRDEARAWLRLGGAGVRALVTPLGEDGLVRRGTFIKTIAQRTGFLTTYWRRGETTRWRMAHELDTDTVS